MTALYWEISKRGIKLRATLLLTNVTEKFDLGVKLRNENLQFFDNRKF